MQNILPIELISHPLCPYVQRTAITLLEKQIDFKTTFIDLANKPTWFLDISPMGKIPVLRVGPHVLFESAIINEYLDETHPPTMHPETPLEKASQRAWIEFSGSVIMLAHQILSSPTLEELQNKILACSHKLSQVEQELKENPYFNGKTFCLIDAAFAPGLLRLTELEKIYPMHLFDHKPKVKTWVESLLARESVQKSLVPDFKDQYRQMIKSKGGFLATQICV